MQLKLCIKTYINTFCKNYSYDELKTIIECINQKQKVEPLHVSRKLTHTDVEAVQQLLDYYNSNTDTLLDIYNKYKNRNKKNRMMTGGGLFDSLKEAAKKTAEGVSDAAKKAATEAAAQAKKTATDAATQAKKAATDAAQEAATQAKNAAQQAIEQAKNAAQDQLSGLKQTMGTLIEQKFNALNNDIKNIIKEQIEELLKKYVNPDMIAASVIEKLAKAG